MTIMIIGGTPGAGKTSVAAWLAEQSSRAVHLKTDYFFDFVRHKLDPSKPESKQQNETVVRAYLSAAKRYAEGGYSVFLDGVIGPWLLPQICGEFERFDYVILHASETVTLNRIAARRSQTSAKASVALRMHAQFEQAFDAYPSHVVHTDGLSIEMLGHELLTKQAAGLFLMTRAHK